MGLRAIVFLKIVFSLFVVVGAIPLRVHEFRHDHLRRHEAHATYRKRLYARGMELEFYHPKSSFKVSPPPFFFFNTPIERFINRDTR
jgi:hypothetical protein